MTENQNDALDHLLTRHLITPPDDFPDTVISKLAEQSAMNTRTDSTNRLARPWFWPTAALATGSAVGVVQIISFIFGIWIPATVG